MPRSPTNRSNSAPWHQHAGDCGGVHFRNPSGVATLVNKQREMGVQVVEESLFLEVPFEDAMMFGYKVQMCPKRTAHNWNYCPFAHPGEHACRRDPRLFQYSGTKCREKRRGRVCSKGDECPYSHNVFESWLHPRRYRTMMCLFGTKCERTVCFFAHTQEELRKPHDMDINELARMAMEDGLSFDIAQLAGSNLTASPASSIDIGGATDLKIDGNPCNTNTSQPAGGSHDYNLAQNSTSPVRSVSTQALLEALSAAAQGQPVSPQNLQMASPNPSLTAVDGTLPSIQGSALTPEALQVLGHSLSLSPASLLDVQAYQTLQLQALLARGGFPAHMAQANNLFGATSTPFNTPQTLGMMGFPEQQARVPFNGSLPENGPLNCHLPVDWNRSNSGGNMSWGSLMSTQSSLGSAADWMGGVSRVQSNDLQDIRSRASLVTALVDTAGKPTMTQHTQEDDHAAFTMAIQRALQAI